MPAQEVPAASAGASRRSRPPASDDDGMSGGGGGGMMSSSGAAAAGGAAGGGGGGGPSLAPHASSSAIANEPVSPISTAPTLATGAHELEWADTNLGRPAALAANAVLGAAAGTTKMVGWTVGDSNLHVRSGFRSLAAMHLRVSARVHHVAFYHPSLDAEIAAPSSSSSFGGGGGLSSSSYHGSSGGKKVLDGVRHAIGLEGKGGSMDWSAEEAARLAAVVESESFRLSRDGIVEQHFARRRSSSGRAGKSSSPFRNRKVMSTPDRTLRAAASRPAAAAAGTGAVTAEEGRGAMATPRKDTRRASANSSVEGDSEHGGDEIPNEPDAGATSSSSSKPRKFVVASRIPQSAENRRTSAGNTPEATLSQMIKKKGKKGRSKERDAIARAASAAATASAGGNVNRGATSTIAKQGSPVSNDEGDSIGKLLAEHAAPVAFDPDNITGDGAALAGMIKTTPAARIGRYLPEVACRVPSSSVYFHLKGDMRHVQSTQPFVVEAPHVIFGGGRDRLIRRVAADGNPLVDARRFEYLSNNELSMSQRTESLLCAGATVWVDVAKSPKKNTKTAVDVAKNIGNAATKTAHDTNKGVKKMFKCVTPKRSKKKKSSAAEDIPDDASNPSERPSLDGSSAAVGVGEVSAVIDETLPLGDISTQGTPARANEENAGSLSVSSSRLPDAPRPYVLVLDDVLEFRVQEFPSNSTIASFPISVASILNNTDMEERLNNPRRPSELTVTLVQEPSIKEKKWGCEVKITFRCAEVRPDSPLAMEKPEQDDKGRWTKSSLDDRMKRMRVHLKNVGQPKEKIEEEIRAMEEKELEEEEEREAAIIMAGTGKGYEQGASAREIVKRQMFYDPEREEFRRKSRAFNSNDLNSGVIREVALTSSPNSILGSKKSTKKSSSKQRRMSPISDIPDIPIEILSFDNNERQQTEVPLANASNMSTDEPTEGKMKSTTDEAESKSCVEREEKEEAEEEEEGPPSFSIQDMRSQYGSARDLLLPDFEGDSNNPSKVVSSEIEQNDETGEENEVFVSAQTGSSTATGTSSLRKLERRKNNVSVAFKSIIEEPSPTAAAKRSEITSVDIPSQSKEVSCSKPSENDIFFSAVHGPATMSESKSSLVDRKQSRNESIDSFFSDDSGAGDDSDADAFSPRSAATTESATFSPSREAAIAREEEEERAARQRDRKRLSMQSMALMHLTLGGAAQQKNLLGDEMDLLIQIAFEEEEDKLGGSKSSIISRRSAGAVSISSPDKKKQQQQQQQITSTSRMKEYGTSIRDKGKRVLLEEYPGLMILLCVILSVVSVKVFFRLLLYTT